MAKNWKKNKYRSPVKRESDKNYNQLFKEATRLSNKVNKKLNAIQRDFGSIGWAGNKLREKTERSIINTWTSKGVKVTRRTSEDVLKATIKAMNNFLQSETGTVKGLYDVMKRQQDSLRATLSTEDVEITKEESEAIYKLFNDKDFQFLSRFVPQDSDLIIILEDTKENGDSFETFERKCNFYFNTGQDDDIKDALKRLYDRWMS